MSEERMERKSVARSVPSKATAPDCKKSDAAHKAWPRSGKKRESSNGRSEPLRRQLPVPRGGASGRGRSDPHRTALCRDEGSGLAEEDAELGSVFVPGSKKQSLNHLLKFVYSPRVRGDAPARRIVPRARVSAVHPHHAELFLQASCQFAVQAGGDYTPHLLDPDLPVEWERVEHVVVRAAGEAECPVCLCAPVAARVTRCGHVYCWACALHYVAVHERAQPPCPVCAAPLHVDQLKSATLRRTPTAPQLQEVRMRLVRRARGSTLVEPAPARDAPSAAVASALPAWSTQHDMPFAKIVIITTEQVREIVARERREVGQQILAEIDTSELVYLEQVLELLQKKETALEEQPAAASTPAPTSRTPSTPTVHHDTELSGPRQDWFDVDEDGASTEIIQKLSIDDSKEELEEAGASTLNAEADEFSSEAAWGSEGGAGEMLGVEEFPLLEDSDELLPEEGLPVLTERDKDNQSKYFYFYQAEDGQHVFLHSVDVRLLTASWGALAAAPTTITGRLLRTESFCLTQQTRKHMPCAAHLPLYCPYDVVELDLQPPHVTRRALHLLADELSRRARTRLRAERDDRRRERRATPRAPAAPHPASYAHFPPARSYSPPPAHTPSQTLDDTYTSPPQQSCGLSFAKMAGSSGAWHVRAPPPPLHRAAPADEDEEGAPPPPRALRLSDAIEAALQAAPAPTPAPGGGSRRKKNKPKLLFSTGVPRTA